MQPCAQHRVSYFTKECCALGTLTGLSFFLDRPFQGPPSLNQAGEELHVKCEHAEVKRNFETFQGCEC